MQCQRWPDLPHIVRCVQFGITFNLEAVIFLSPSQLNLTENRVAGVKIVVALHGKSVVVVVGGFWLRKQ